MISDNQNSRTATTRMPGFIRAKADHAGMVNDEQVRRLVKLRKTEKTLATAAAKAGMDDSLPRTNPGNRQRYVRRNEKTARKWLGSERLPSQCTIEG